METVCVVMVTEGEISEFGLLFSLSSLDVTENRLSTTVAAAAAEAASLLSSTGFMMNLEGGAEAVWEESDPWGK